MGVCETAKQSHFDQDKTSTDIPTTISYMPKLYKNNDLVIRMATMISADTKYTGKACLNPPQLASAHSNLVNLTT